MICSRFSCGFLFAALLVTGCDRSGKSLPVADVPASAVPVDETLKRAELGDKSAMFAYAKSQASAGQQVVAFGWFLKAAEAGEPDAMAEVAIRYRDGIGVREDGELSDEWVVLAGAKGVPAAIYEAVLREDYPYGSGGRVRVIGDSLAQCKAKLLARTALLEEASAAGYEKVRVRFRCSVLTAPPAAFGCQTGTLRCSSLHQMLKPSCLSWS